MDNEKKKTAKSIRLSALGLFIGLTIMTMTAAPAPALSIPGESETQRVESAESASIENAAQRAESVENAAPRAEPITVMEVASELGCPCECPLILQDCNMSCGLRWKDEIGVLISEGKTREEIIDYFIAEYGEEARLGPTQKLHGKVYQYTRGFGTLEWVMLGTGTFIWAFMTVVGIFVVVKRLTRRNEDQGANER